jgi:hypothetical protein
MPLRAVLLALASLAAPPAGADPHAAVVAGLARQFDRHAIVHVGEFHRSREIHALLQALLRDPAFACRIDDVVVEFGNARLQPLADAYARGDAVDEAQVRSMLRETMVPLAWNSPVYRDVYAAVRAINGGRLCDHPVRLVLADAPVDWAAIATAGDLAAVVDRDEHMARVVEREVLAKGRRALLVTGQYHALRQLPADLQEPGQPPVLAQRLERGHPGASFVVLVVPSPAAGHALGMAPAPSLRVLRGSPLAQVDFAMARPLWPQGQTLAREHRLRLGEVADAVVYLGGNHSVFPSPTIYLEPGYQAELRRRARILKDYSGQDFESVLDDLVRQATEGGDGRQANVPAE